MHVRSFFFFLGRYYYIVESYVNFVLKLNSSGLIISPGRRGRTRDNGMWDIGICLAWDVGYSKLPGLGCGILENFACPGRSDIGPPGPYWAWDAIAGLAAFGAAAVVLDRVQLPLVA